MSLPECYRCRKQPCECKDGITLYCADCREVLPLLEPGSVDLVLTDPPYGIGAERHHGRKCGGKAVANKKDYGYIGWDEKPADDASIALCVQAGKQAIIWGGNYFVLPPRGSWLVWDKDNGSNPWADCELAWTNLEISIRKFRHRWMGMLQENGGRKKEPRVHPTQKPLSLIKWCVTLADDPQTILDPFAGSGTTGRACKDLGRKCIMIEIEEKYCQIAARRLEQEVLFT